MIHLARANGEIPIYLPLQIARSSLTTIVCSTWITPVGDASGRAGAGSFKRGVSRAELFELRLAAALCPRTPGMAARGGLGMTLVCFRGRLPLTLSRRLKRQRHPRARAARKVKDASGG